jgi:hypothetical protein
VTTVGVMTAMNATVQPHSSLVANHHNNKTKRSPPRRRRPATLLLLHTHPQSTHPPRPRPSLTRR